jgi:uncharacterized protein YjbI with pentapeptide repeats
MAKDFTRRDLRGCSFRGQDLSAAVFHGSDLRGADFSGANLKDADLSASRTGMRRNWEIALLLVALALSAAMGVVSGLGGAWLKSLMQSPEPRLRFIGVFLTLQLAIFLLMFVWRGLSLAIRRVLPFSLAVALGVALAAILTGAGSGTGFFAVLAFSGLLAAVVGFASVARVAAGAAGTAMFVLVAVAGALVGGALGGGLYATAVALAGMVAARRALRARGSHAGLTRIGVNVACAKGTRFRDSDLTGATFASAHLRGADFRGAVLEGTRFDAARMELCAFDADA